MKVKIKNENPLHLQNWLKQTNWKFIKYIIHHKHSMTPELLEQKPFEEITKIQHEKIDTDERESTKDEEEFTISQELSEGNSTSDISTETTEESKPTETSQVLTVFNKTIHHEDDSSEDKSDTIADDTEGPKSTEDEEVLEAIEVQQVHNVLNKTTHDKKDTSDQNSVTELKHLKRMGSKIIEKRTNSLLPIFKLKLKTEKLKGS